MHAYPFSFLSHHSFIMAFFVLNRYFPVYHFNALFIPIASLLGIFLEAVIGNVIQASPLPLEHLSSKGRDTGEKRKV